MFIKKLTKPVFILTQIFEIAVLVFFTFGCASNENNRPLADDDIKYADTKALIEDKVKGDSHTVSIDTFYRQDGNIKLEITALLGYPLGSLLMNRSQISYAVHPQKLFVQGPFQARTLKPLFKQELDPRLIWAAVFDQDLRKYGFVCSAENIRQLCEGTGKAAGVSVLLENIGPNLEKPKKITIETSTIKFVWVFKSIRKHNKSYNETFVLNPPENYRLLNIK